ncbi:mitochondrial import inner membrane translocase subunit 17 [Heterostelium album PN500]|uniref:Mitochondrial import inner membrane translocase subunit 17 n=1 Tax=Heterostelium pallidum (strain ATCC 26659 / Pp 5 / PN500) TaxID=670386 RepID=D3BGE0_HETP5|nr:mitochondrial import inner membrane translocase subunit 17 [Heterostelium album PN500]EFA79540.1 mitochondrial import inner membrane translocase subunit 17 [Heterostelium album PN500]|eukprot:XP_020431661.1 mitochondrial import inner membrane translocase subunit 17 [Heterostelium album PN500]
MEQPCPERIWTDIGVAFSMGCVFSTIGNTFSGVRNAPRGERIVNAFTLVRKNAPRLGGNFAVWGTLFSGFDCTLAYIRKKEDYVNPIAAGALTGGVLAARAGWKASVVSAAFGGAFIGLFEVFQHVIEKFNSQQKHEQMLMYEQHQKLLQEEQQKQKQQAAATKSKSKRKDDDEFN